MHTSSYGDPTTAPFWAAAARHQLVIQRCAACEAHQFYPRPFCLRCGATDVRWVEAAGTGTVYSMTTVRIAVRPELRPPYTVALVQLDEGPRLLAHLVDDEGAIGDRVRVDWRARPDAPPLPVFRRIAAEPVSQGAVHRATR